jgi:transcriptional regulator with XRE-family HTH domain
MPENLTAEEVAVLIRARRLLKEKGLATDTDVKTLCEQAGISRKTGYQWEKRLFDSSSDVEEKLRRELEQLNAEHEKLKKEYEDVSWENRGRKLAWEIHEVDALLAEKKSTIGKGKKKKR